MSKLQDLLIHGMETANETSKGVGGKTIALTMFAEALAEYEALCNQVSQLTQERETDRENILKTVHDMDRVELKALRYREALEEIIDRMDVVLDVYERTATQVTAYEIKGIAQAALQNTTGDAGITRVALLAEGTAFPGELVEVPKDTGMVSVPVEPTEDSG